MPKNLGNCSRLAWATPWRLGGGVKERTGLLTKNHFGTQTKAFSFAPPFKNPWDAYARETMGGQSCCPRAPLCMAVLPMSKNLGNHCWLAGTGPWRSSGRCRGEGHVGLSVGKAKIIGCPYQTDCHPSTRTSTPPPGPQTGSCSIDTPPTRIIWTLGRMGLQGKAGALTACRGEARVQ